MLHGEWRSKFLFAFVRNLDIKSLLSRCQEVNRLPYIIINLTATAVKSSSLLTIVIL